MVLVDETSKEASEEVIKAILVDETSKVTSSTYNEAKVAIASLNP